MSRDRVPYKFLALEGMGYPLEIEGDRDALCELRSAINDALSRGEGHAVVSYENGDDALCVVKRLGA